METKEAIALKGYRDGVKIIVSRDASIREILDSLHGKASEYRSFFKGICNIIVTGRSFSSSDKLRINSVMSAILPNCPVTYEETPSESEIPKIMHEENFSDSDKDIFEDKTSLSSPGIQKTILKFFGVKSPEDIHNSLDYTPQASHSDYTEVRGKLCDNIYVFDGCVKSNNRLRAAGDLLIIGDVEQGAEVIAIGNIYVIGKAQGKIWAGCNGNKDAQIISYSLCPDEMRIADIYLRFPSRPSMGQKRPEKAHLIKNTIYIDEYL